MIERELPRRDVTCPCGTRARLYERLGDRQRVYFVECAPCGLRTARFSDPADAVNAWRRGDRQDWVAIPMSALA